MPRRRAAEDTASGAHSPTAVAGWERDEPNAAQSSSQRTRWWFACLRRGVPDVAPPDEVQGSVKTTLSGLPDVEAMRRCGLPVQMPCVPRESAAGGAPGRRTSPVGRGSTAYATWSLAKIDRGTVAAISKGDAAPDPARGLCAATTCLPNPLRGSPVRARLGRCSLGPRAPPGVRRSAHRMSAWPIRHQFAAQCVHRVFCGFVDRGARCMGGRLGPADVRRRACDDQMSVGVEKPTVARRIGSGAWWSRFVSLSLMCSLNSAGARPARSTSMRGAWVVESTCMRCPSRPATVVVPCPDANNLGSRAAGDA